MYDTSTCAPTNAFLQRWSSAFHVCVPTPLAFLSTCLGVLSILSWLFAQLPQVIKNYRIRSTSGLSIYFLVEWCGGDLSNLLGALLTGQARWQVVVAGYYCFVDCALIAQYVWYEVLEHGSDAQRRKQRRALAAQQKHEGGGTGGGNMVQVVIDRASGDNPSSSQPLLNAKHEESAPRDIFAFRTPDYSTFTSASTSPTTTLTQDDKSDVRRGARTTYNSPFPGPSPRTILLASMIIGMLSRSTTASPLAPVSHPITPKPAHSTPPVGTILSWMSTTLYLGSRLPQLIKNYRRQSTAGLSPLLFTAAFLGNLFYSSSLLTNPQAWQSCPASNGSCRGWAGPAGSEQDTWVLAALPFFLGAAGVLIMDAGVGVQFWLYDDRYAKRPAAALPAAATAAHSASHREPLSPATPTTTEPIPIAVAQRRAEEERPTGWLRGWIPSLGSFSRAASFGGRVSPPPPPTALFNGDVGVDGGTGAADGDGGHLAVGDGRLAVPSPGPASGGSSGIRALEERWLLAQQQERDRERDQRRSGDDDSASDESSGARSGLQSREG